MDFERLPLQHVLHIPQLTQLAQPLSVCNLALELLDAQGTVIMPASCAERACQQARHALGATVLAESAAQTRQCPGGGTVAGVPIRPFSTTLGALLACQPQHAASALDSTALVALLSTLVEQCHTTAMQRLEIDNLTTELLSRYEQLTFLFDFGRHLNPLCEPAQLFERIINMVAELYGSTYVIGLYHKDTLRHLAVGGDTSNRPLPELTAGALSLCQHVVQQVYSSKHTVVRNALSSATEAAAVGPYTAVLATPILVENQWYGTLNIFGTDVTTLFVQSDIALAELVAKQAGIFLENHRLYQRLEAAHQAQKMEALGRLAGTIAHDFNNILFAILGYGELVCEDLPVDNPARENLDIMLNSAKRAKDMVHQILTFSRRDTESHEPVQLIDVTKEVLALLRGSLPATVDMRSVLPTTGCHIVGNATQLHQVLMNLGTNAIHAMQEQGGVLTLSLTETELDADVATHHGVAPGMYASLTVRDTGCGMPPEVLERIFEPFFTTKGSGQGTGMGLSLVHSVIQRHHGAITVTSILGQGTTFQVFLPLSEGLNLLPERADVTQPLFIDEDTYEGEEVE